MFIVITMAYLIFWGPLFVVTLANYTDDWKAAKKSMAHEVQNTTFSILQDQQFREFCPFFSCLGLFRSSKKLLAASL